MSKTNEVLSIVCRERFRVVFGLLFILFAGSSLASSFVKVELPQKISFQMPINWLVLSANKTITVDAFIESVLPKATSDLKFQANLKNDKAQPITTVQVHFWSSEYQQSDIIEFSEADVVAYNHNMYLKITDELDMFNAQITSWIGTMKENINGLGILRSEYRRISVLLQGHVRVQILRAYCGQNSFSFVITYHEEEVLPLRPIIDKMISTLRSDVCQE
jgi:hypothetical protein